MSKQNTMNKQNCRVLEDRTNCSSNTFEDQLIENVSLYFEQKLETTWCLLDFIQFRKKQKMWTKNKDIEFKLFKQCLLVKTINMELAIRDFMIKNYNSSHSK
ncbi:23589_t:CDS:1 [Racocetra persica]|uniref:23589_t:CDS:1 n=1 Tax=Racocetra persica TaxID=160502 RepID=A0ACA9PJK5_9GLOM|nr:23589_t:CDS:1 [Racocetra persica]